MQDYKIIPAKNQSCHDGVFFENCATKWWACEKMKEKRDVGIDAARTKKARKYGERIYDSHIFPRDETKTGALRDNLSAKQKKVVEVKNICKKALDKTA